MKLCVNSDKKGPVVLKVGYNIAPGFTPLIIQRGGRSPEHPCSQPADGEEGNVSSGRLEEASDERDAEPARRMNRSSRVFQKKCRSVRAFTMIEIAISLAVIGFALVAIIGILPAGMNVQKENRQETIITQDASVFINAIRDGDRGIDDLTNYVLAITNYGAVVGPNGGLTPDLSWYTPQASFPPNYALTNGLRIVGLLSTPRYELLSPGQNGMHSNYIVAYVRSISGLASEKFPQTNRDAQEFAMRYRIFVEVLPYGTNQFDESWTNFGAIQLSGTSTIADTNRWLQCSNSWMLARNYEPNHHDLRLTFRWPYPTSPQGGSRQVFRTTVAGSLFPTNEPGFGGTGYRLFFFEPRNYVQVNP